MDVILSAYFNSVKDQQRNKFWSGNDFRLIKEWYESVVRLGLNAIVFHDNLEEKFIKTYQRENIRFVRYQPKGDPTSARFTCFYEHLKAVAYDRVFMVDITDVVINKNPFPLIEKDFVVIGYEENLIQRGGFVEKYFKNAYGEIHHEGKRVLNNGILGAEYSLISELLRLFNWELQCCKVSKMVDLAIWNMIIYGMEFNYKTGFPIVTRFGKEEINDCYFKHK